MTQYLLMSQVTAMAMPQYFPLCLLSSPVCLSVSVGVVFMLPLTSWLPAQPVNLPSISTSPLQYICPGSYPILHQIIVSNTVVVTSFRPSLVIILSAEYLPVFNNLSLVPQDHPSYICLFAHLPVNPLATPAFPRHPPFFLCLRQPSYLFTPPYPHNKPS